MSHSPTTRSSEASARAPSGLGRPPAIRISRWGRFAAAVLRAEPGRVIAVFERSLCIESENGIACLGMIGDGPLNACCAPLAVRAGAIVARRGTMLRIGAHEVVADRTTTWTPAKAALALDLARVARLTPPPDGLGAVAVTLARGEALPTHTALLRHAAPAIEALRAHDLDGASRLIGLGPGLTPSGDDFVGGYLIARPDPALAAWALAAARTLTSRISAAHLGAAAAGEGAAPLHDALGGGTLEPLLALGHSSGWDMLAGATLALTSAR